MEHANAGAVQLVGGYGDMPHHAAVLHSAELDHEIVAARWGLEYKSLANDPYFTSIGE